MILLRPCPIKAEKFILERNIFSADVGRISKDIRALGRVFEGHDLIGFTIVSENEETSTVFAASRAIEYGEYTLAWEFACVTPGLTHMKAVIYND